MTVYLFIALMLGSQNLFAFDERLNILEFAGEADALYRECIDKKCSPSRMRFLREARKAAAGALQNREKEIEMSRLKSTCNNQVFLKAPPSNVCRYNEVKKNISRYGVEWDSGGPYFNKIKNGSITNYSEARGGIEPRIRVSETQSAIFVQTTDGKATYQEDYIFDVKNGKKCNLIQVSAREVPNKNSIELNYSDCQNFYEQFFTKCGFKPVGRPQDIERERQESERKLGLCLKYQLLPLPKELKNKVEANKSRPSPNTVK